MLFLKCHQLYVIVKVHNMYSTYIHFMIVGSLIIYILCLEEMCIGAVRFIISQFCKFFLQSLSLLDIF